jgi:hypothetical protein
LLLADIGHESISGPAAAENRQHKSRYEPFHGLYLAPLCLNVKKVCPSTQQFNRQQHLLALGDLALRAGMTASNAARRITTTFRLQAAPCSGTMEGIMITGKVPRLLKNTGLYHNLRVILG